jgi:hypothetical protein
MMILKPNLDGEPFQGTACREQGQDGIQAILILATLWFTRVKLSHVLPDTSPHSHVVLSAMIAVRLEQRFDLVIRDSMRE